MLDEGDEEHLCKHDLSFLVPFPVRVGAASSTIYTPMGSILPLALNLPPVVQMSLKLAMQKRRVQSERVKRAQLPSQQRESMGFLGRCPQGGDKGTASLEPWLLTISNITYISISQRPNDFCYILCSDQFQTVIAGSTCSDELSITQVSLRTEKIQYCHNYKQGVFAREIIPLRI